MRGGSTRKIGDYAQQLELMVEQIGRMGKIVDNIRAFARKSDLEPVGALEPLDKALMLVAERLRRDRSGAGR